MKRTLSLFLALAMTLSLAACGGGGGTSSGGTKNPSTSNPGTNQPAGSTSGGGTASDGGMFAGGWGDANQPFDPLAVQETWTFEEMRAALGAVPASSAELALAANIRPVGNVYWQDLNDGYLAMNTLFQQAGYSLADINIKPAQSEDDTEGQLADMKDQVRLGVNAIMASPISTSNCTEAVENAHDSNIPTIAVNNEFNGADMFIGPNSYTEGEQAAEWAEANVGEGKAVVIMGLAGTDVVKNRTEGFVNKLAELGSSIEVVDQQNADWDRSKAKDVCTTLLRTYDDLKIIFCNNDVMALGAVEAVKETDKVLGQDIFIIGADGTDEAYASIEAGELSATVAMFPYYEGMMATEVTLRILLGQSTPLVVWTPSMAIDASNIDQASTREAQAGLLGWTDPTFG